MTTEVSEQPVVSVYLAYSETSETFYQELLDIMLRDYPEIEFEGYHDNKLKERKKSFGLRSKYGARLTPFVAVELDSTPIKAFYTEVVECTVDNIKTFLDAYLNNQKIVENANTSN
jgi:hypothetical protein